MLSIKKYMAESPGKLTTSLVRVPYAILESLAAKSVNYDLVEHGKNRAALRGFRKDLEVAKNSTEVLEATGGIIRAIETYNRGVTRHMELRAQEMSAMASMLAAKLHELAEGSGTSAENLRGIGQRLENAAHIQDIQVLKDELAESLQGVQQAAAHQQEQSVAIRAESREFMDKMSRSANFTANGDPATGLPGPDAVEFALEDAIESHMHAYMVLFAVGLSAVNRRFGAEYGDRALASFAKQIASLLAPGDLLFRWKGPTLAALLDRPESNESAPPEMSRFAAFKPEFALEIDGKSTTIPLSMSSISFRLWKYNDLPAVHEVLDQCLQTVAPGALQEAAKATGPA
jgi:GGDEF domain-containing protein